MSELFTNLARSTLASGITAGAVSLTVQSGDGNDLFPVLGGSDNFRCVLFKKSTGDIEIINVTARSGDVFTIARAQEQIGNIAATAFAFDAGDLIELRPTSAFYTGLAGGASSANIQNGIFLYGVDTGAADVYTVAMNPTAASVTDGQEIRVKIGAGNTNTGIAATLQLDALATLDITMEGGGNPPSGSIKAGFVHTFIVNGTDAIFQSAGLALTSSGFNALGKQIKNVAAGTASTDVATIGGTETLSNKEISGASFTGTQTGFVGDVDAETIVIDGAAGTSRVLSYKTSGSKRWAMTTSLAAESGGNAGSDYTIKRYDDSGVLIADAMNIDRASGLTEFENLDSASVGSAIAGLSAGAVGTYAFARNNTGDTAFGSSTSGNDLITCSAARSVLVTGISANAALDDGGTLSGTWMCMGTQDQFVTGTDMTLNGATIWLKISA